MERELLSKRSFFIAIIKRVNTIDYYRKLYTFWGNYVSHLNIEDILLNKDGWFSL